MSINKLGEVIVRETLEEEILGEVTVKLGEVVDRVGEVNVGFAEYHGQPDVIEPSGSVFKIKKSRLPAPNDQV